MKKINLAALFLLAVPAMQAQQPITTQRKDTESLEQFADVFKMTEDELLGLK